MPKSKQSVLDTPLQPIHSVEFIELSSSESSHLIKQTFFTYYNYRLRMIKYWYGDQKFLELKVTSAILFLRIGGKLRT